MSPAIILLALLSLAASPSQAASVYVNGVQVDGLRNQDFSNVTVHIDGNGDIHIDAKGYQVQVLPPSTVPAAPSVPPTSKAPSYSPMPTTPPASSAPAYAAPTHVQPAPPSTPTASAPPVTGAVAPGGYWMVTEDNTSQGHAIEVRINGSIVRTIRSGEPQIIVDLGSYLIHGSNIFTMTALQGGTPGGGAMHIYVGTGSNDSGVVRMDAPTIDYLRRSTSVSDGSTQTYTFQVP